MFFHRLSKIVIFENFIFSSHVRYILSFLYAVRYRESLSCEKPTKISLGTPNARKLLLIRTICFFCLLTLPIPVHTHRIVPIQSGNKSAGENPLAGEWSSFALSYDIVSFWWQFVLFARYPRWNGFPLLRVYSILI